MKTRRIWVDVDIGNIDGFGEAWWLWWGALQPDEQTNMIDEMMITPTDNMDWRKVRKMGKNRLPLVMVTLSWWGRASMCGEGWWTTVRDISTQSSAWEGQKPNQCLCCSWVPVVPMLMLVGQSGNASGRNYIGIDL